MRTPQPHPIRKRRQAAGLTQEALGEKVGVSKAAVSRWESGTDEPDSRNARKLRKVLPRLTFDDIYPPITEEAA